jgi:hypothetical protein
LDRFGALDQLEHLRIEVDRDDASPESKQRMRDTTRAAADLENLRASGISRSMSSGSSAASRRR